jgi:hypothetical protein
MTLFYSIRQYFNKKLAEFENMPAEKRIPLEVCIAILGGFLFTAGFIMVVIITANSLQK